MAFGLTASEAPDLTTIRVAGYLGDAMAVYRKGKAVKTLVVGVAGECACLRGSRLARAPQRLLSCAQATAPAAKPKAPEAAKPKVQEAAVVTLRGTVEAIDKEKQTVTLKGPKRTLTVQVQDPKKLDAIKVGDPVVGKYYEALASR